MASLSRKGASKIAPHMNVTPLVDVVLVLLIIFMVVIPAAEQGLDVEVPGIVHADEETEDKAEPFVLSVTGAGRLYFEDTPLSAAGLEAHLRAASRSEPSRKLVIRGDRSVGYGGVRPLLAIAQSVGFPGVSLRVKQRMGEE